MEEFYGAVHHIVGELINTKNFYIALISADGRELQFPYWVNELDTAAPAGRAFGAGGTEYVIRTRKALLADLAELERLNAAGELTLSGPSPRSWLGVPLICTDSVVGVVAVQSYSSQVCYNARDQELLTFVSYQIASSLERRRAGEALKSANAELEQRVAERTRELREQISVRQLVELALQQRNTDLEALNSKLAGAQSQLLQSEKMASVGQLAAGVAHEINNPIGYVRSNLNSLTGYLQDIFSIMDAYEQLERSLSGTQTGLAQVQALKERIDLVYLRGDIVNLLAESVEGATRVEKIVNDLKDFSHVDQAEWQRADLHAGLETTLNVARHELKYKADVIKDYGDLPQIACLPSQLNQVFLNILVNAAHAIEGHGTITIRTRCEDDHVLVTIADTGKGIDARHINRVFEPFFTTKPVGVGTGLGLSVSYGIIQKHGGTIQVQSELGAGTTFAIRLPIEQSQIIVS
jgi:signal transduction histidine kinase